ncbi:MAG: transporter [Moritella sp.]|uniref:transporter n=1 Tax=Moritella sp. TaxID=78556 RepID=UPI0029A21EE6|nr:transporter [Moritella sp.]MDX2319378.1 transporter [Moritella sp.]
MKMNKISTMLAVSLSFCITTVFAADSGVDHSKMDHSQMQTTDTADVDHGNMDHSGMMNHANMQMAPAGIMKSHNHKKGGFMFSYGFMSMGMEGIKNGTDKASTQDVLADSYSMAPSEMSMKMHMLGAMYGMTDDLTLAVMTGYASKEMTMLMPMMMAMMEHDGESSGITDTEVSIVDGLNRYGLDNLVISYGFSLPTGSIDETYDGKKLGYPMQLGSGTFDFVPSITYQQMFNDSWGYGVQGRATVRIGNNSADYRLGNEYEASTWLTKGFGKRFSISAIIDVAYNDNISGADSDMMASMSPSKDPLAREATVITAGLSGRYNLGSGHNLLLRVDVPIYEDFTGYQLMTDYKLAVNYKKMF